MAIHYDLTVQGDTLQARAWGFDESLEDVQSYGLALIDACREHGVTRVMCDERELDYRLNTFEHYEAAEFIAQQVPALAKVAIVCNPHCLPAADLYEDVVVNRGLMLRIFTDIDQARAWLEGAALTKQAPGLAAPAADSPDSGARVESTPVPRLQTALSLAGFVVLQALLYVMLSMLALALSQDGRVLVWPAAGLALALVLHQGNRALPGIGLGAFLVISLQRASMVQAPDDGWLPGLCLTGGAILQAGAGAWLCRKQVEPVEGALERASDLLRLMLWGGGVGAMMAVSVGVTALTLTGALTTEAAGYAWWQGYTADAWGVVLFTPVSLYLLQRRERPPGEPGRTSAAMALLLFGTALWPLWLSSPPTPETMTDRSWDQILAIPLHAGPVSPFRLTPWPQLLAAVGLQLLVLGVWGRNQALQRRSEELGKALRHTLRLFNDSPLPTWVYDADTLRFLMVNERAMALYGWPREAWPGLSLRDIVPDERLADYLETVQRGAADPSTVEHQHRRRNGTLMTVRVNASPTRHGERLARLEVIEDITAGKHAERALIESEKRFRKLFEDTRQTILLFDNFHCIAANPAALTMLRAARPEHIVGATLAQLSPPRQPDGRSSDETAAEMTRIALEEGAYEFEWELLRGDGEAFMAQVMMTLIHQSGRDLLHVVLIDITEQRNAREQIEYMTFHDALTGLPNRILGQDRLMHDIARAERQHTSLAVIYLDVDKFKFINDTHGHRLGDHLLQALARRLAQDLRGEDTLCRLSGDEFMIVLPDTHSQVQVARVIESIQQQLAEPFELEGTRLVITLSLGVAFYPQDGVGSETLMLNADMALYEAKKAGPNSCRLFTPAINDELTRFVQTRNALRTALEQRTFELHYQPQLDLRTGRMIGVEALLRWRRTDGTLAMPSGFIGVAEDSGLIVPIGRWALRQACRQAALWQTRSWWPRAVMAVNLSAVQFRQEGFAEEVLAALEDSGLDPRCLELELTESLLLENQQSILATVKDWKEHGIQLSLDDFGTGYSSLAYLKQFKVDKLKIDRSFIMNLTNHPEDRAIVKAIVQLAHGLSMRAIAEGVEEAATVDTLRALGCDELQGYWYSRPLAATALETWLSRAHPAASDPMGKVSGTTEGYRSE